MFGLTPLLTTAMAAGVFAQQRNAAPGVIENAVQRPAAPAADEPLDEMLAREVLFMAKAGELTPEQVDALELEARKTLRRWNPPVGSRATAEALRRELSPLLKDISRSAWEKFDRERQALDVRRKHAAILAQVAELDEALFLLDEQRTTLVERLMQPTGMLGTWQPHNQSPPLTGSQRLPAVISAGDLGALNVTDIQLAPGLWPAQFVAYKQLRSGAARLALFAENGQNVNFLAVGHHVTEDEEVRRLKIRLDRFIDTSDTVCRLNESEREKLRMAGKLDIESFHDRYLAIASSNDTKPIEKLARYVAIAEAAKHWFFDPMSNFQKALTARLTAEQKSKLVGAVQARDAFRRQTLVEAVVVGFERSAALNSAQCAALTRALHDALAAHESPADWRVDCLRTIVALADVTLRRILADEQWPAAKRHLATLASVADQLEAQAAQKVVAFRDFAGAVVHDGKVESKFHADELRLDVK